MNIASGVKVFDGHFHALKHDMKKLKKKELAKIIQEIGIIFKGYCLVDKLSMLDNVISGMLKELPVPRTFIKYYKEREIKKVKEFMEIVDV